MKLKRYAKVTPDMLEDLRADTNLLRLAKSACPSNDRMAFAWAFGWKFRGYAAGMTTWEMDSAAYGLAARLIGNHEAVGVAEPEQTPNGYEYPQV